MKTSLFSQPEFRHRAYAAVPSLAFAGLFCAAMSTVRATDGNFGNITASGNVAISGNLVVSGNTTMSGNLTIVSGITGNVTIFKRQGDIIMGVYGNGGGD